MRTIILFILIAGFSISTVRAQRPQKSKGKADVQALKIPDSLSRSTSNIAKFILSSCSSPAERVKAAFIWLACNIDYDVTGIYAANPFESMDQRVSTMLKNQRGICSDYAATFTDLCSRMGLKAYLVSGITKQNGAVDRLSHAWSAVQLDGVWWLFDPTWAAGYVSGGKFVRRYRSDFFMMRPEVCIKSHYPFDYLFQFSDHPIASDEFVDGKKSEARSFSSISCKDSLLVFDSQERMVQVLAAIRRMGDVGVRHTEQAVQVQFLKHEVGTILYNSAVSSYNSGVASFNEFVNYRNRQFTPAKSDAQIQEMFGEAAVMIKKSETSLSLLVESGITVGLDITQLKNSITSVMASIQEQEEWLKKYFSKGKIGRKAMFYKVTFMGVPVR
jgi:hypothetical protein